MVAQRRWAQILRSLIASISDAALEPGLWPAVLESVANFAGVIGAAYIVSDKRSGRVEWASFSGPSVDLKADYISHYSSLDPYRSALDAAENGTWVALSECLPETILRTDEWYNDFVVKSGVGDILGTRLYDGPLHKVIFGIHQEIGRGPFAAATVAAMQGLFEPLSRAACFHSHLRTLGWQSHVARGALEQLAAGVIVVDGHGCVIEINAAAERFLRCNNGLTLRKGRLAALRVFESTRLDNLIIAAANNSAGSEIGRMVIGRRDRPSPYHLTVAPLAADLAFFDRTMAIIVVTDPESSAPTQRELIELFGLSSAESRLALALVAGNKLQDIAPDFGVQVTTLRSQLGSIFRKTGVRRQTDLVRAISRMPVAAR